MGAGTREAFRRSARPGRVSVLRSVVAALAVASLARLFLVDLVVVRGDSMAPTVGGDSVAVLWRSAYGLRSPLTDRYLVRWSEPRPGDIVVIEPGGEGRGSLGRLAIKRVFEVGPAYIAERDGLLCARGGTAAVLTARGAGAPDAYDPGDHPGGIGTADAHAARFLPSGRAFLVGDNDRRSLDSRTYGAVPIEKVQGKVILYRGGLSRRTLDAVDEGRDP